MGRQAYLTRVAFGRSAWEPPVVEDFPFPTLPDSSDGPLLNVFPVGPRQNVQYYDCGGHPISPESGMIARSVRAAQNEIIALTGAIERKRKPEPQVADENKAESEAQVPKSSRYYIPSRIIFVAANGCLDGLRRNIVTKYLISDLSFSLIARRELFSKPFSPIHAFPVRILFTVLEELLAQSVVVTLNYVSDRIDTKSTKDNDWRHKLPLYQGYFSLLARIVVDFACAPLTYHGGLLELGLVKRTFPGLSAWNPGSPFCPYPSLHDVANSSSETAFEAFLRICLSPVGAKTCLFVGGVLFIRYFKPVLTRSARSLADSLEKRSRKPYFGLAWTSWLLPNRLATALNRAWPSRRVTRTAEPTQRRAPRTPAPDDRPESFDAVNSLIAREGNLMQDLFEGPRASTLPLPSSQAEQDIANPDTTEPSVRILDQNSEDGITTMEIEFSVSTEEAVANLVRDAGGSPREEYTVQIHSSNLQTATSEKQQLLDRVRILEVLPRYMFKEIVRLPVVVLLANLQVLHFVYRTQDPNSSMLLRAPYFAKGFVTVLTSEMTGKHLRKLGRNLLLCSGLQFTIQSVFGPRF